MQILLSIRLSLKASLFFFFNVRHHHLYFVVTLSNILFIYIYIRTFIEMYSHRISMYIHRDLEFINIQLAHELASYFSQVQAQIFEKTTKEFI